MDENLGKEQQGAVMHPIDITWVQTQPRLDEATLAIQTFSRKIGKESQSPSDILFRTHKYKICIVGNDNFFKFCERKSRFTVEFELLKKTRDDNGYRKEPGSGDEPVSPTQGDLVSFTPTTYKLEPPKEMVLVPKSTDSKDVEYEEFALKDTPIISYTFGEDLGTNTWNVFVQWPTEQKHISWRGLFSFRISLFKRLDENTYKKVFSAYSSPFSIFSKPNVYFNRATSGRKSSFSSLSPPNVGKPPLVVQKIEMQGTQGQMPVMPLPKQPIPKQLGPMPTLPTMSPQRPFMDGPKQFHVLGSAPPPPVRHLGTQPLIPIPSNFIPKKPEQKIEARGQYQHLEQMLVNTNFDTKKKEIQTPPKVEYRPSNVIHHVAPSPQQQIPHSHPHPPVKVVKREREEIKPSTDKDETLFLSFIEQIKSVKRKEK